MVTHKRKFSEDQRRRRWRTPSFIYIDLLLPLFQSVESVCHVENLRKFSSLKHVDNLASDVDSVHHYSSECFTLLKYLVLNINIRPYPSKSRIRITKTTSPTEGKARLTLDHNCLNVLVFSSFLSSTSKIDLLVTP